tara:strand:+ start:566 stop:1237 length:672 start_codon:yes stop_codon:yes gene_type:complete
MANSTLVGKVKSAYDGQDILITFTKKSVNAKTGDIPQVNILVDREKPTDAIQTGADYSICGDCPLRPINHKDTPIEDKPCYVNCGFGPNAIYKTKDKLEKTDDKVWPIIRHGAYGDPFAVGKKVNDQVKAKAKKVLAYTHAWANGKAKYLAAFCMASVHNLDEKAKANKLGFRTFRTVKFAASKLADDEIVCPNFTKSIQCKTCGLCGGKQTPSVKNIVIPIH